MNSILNTISRLLGLDDENREFDTDLILNINSVFSKLFQIGVGKPFSITGLAETWDDYGISEEAKNMVIMYMYYEVRLSFDPPTSSFVLSSMEKQRDEHLWRLNVMCDKEDNE